MDWRQKANYLAKRVREKGGLWVIWLNGQAVDDPAQLGSTTDPDELKDPAYLELGYYEDRDGKFTADNLLLDIEDALGHPPSGAALGPQAKPASAGAGSAPEPAPAEPEDPPAEPEDPEPEGEAEEERPVPDPAGEPAAQDPPKDPEHDCPACGGIGSLDTGGECNDCGHDTRPEWGQHPESEQGEDPPADSNPSPAINSGATDTSPEPEHEEATVADEKTEPAEEPRFSDSTVHSVRAKLSQEYARSHEHGPREARDLWLELLKKLDEVAG